MAKVLTSDAGRATTSNEVATAPGRGFWSRVFLSIMRSRQQTAEREIAKLIQLRGGNLTDDLEREISRRFGGHAGQ